MSTTQPLQNITPPLPQPSLPPTSSLPPQNFTPPPKDQITSADKDNIFSDGSSSRSRSPSIDHSQNNSRTPSRHSSSHSRSRSKSPSNHSYHSREFIMKNGCCKECMRAFSKTGKSCLCQVPKNERKYILPDKGCNYCGCHGCNPVDVRRDRRSDLKRQLKDDKSLQYKNQRLLDSDDEDLKINVKEVDGWNLKKKDLLYFLKSELKTNPYFMGYGVPMRTPGYILGYIPNKEGSINRKRGRSSNNYNRRHEDDSH